MTMMMMMMMMMMMILIDVRAMRRRRGHNWAMADLGHMESSLCLEQRQAVRGRKEAMGNCGNLVEPSLVVRILFLGFGSSFVSAFRL